jgi:S1-C subfamily serine protease
MPKPRLAPRFFLFWGAPMKNLQQATERICELKGNIVALDALCSALIEHLTPAARERVQRLYERDAEIARSLMLGASISELTIAAFERDVARIGALVASLDRVQPPADRRGAVETLLLAAPRVSTFAGDQALTHASGFFFEREERLYLVTSRHVLIDEPSGHHPDRIEIETHADEQDLSQSTVLSLLLYDHGRANWAQASDSAGEIDVAAIRIDRSILGGFVPRAFTPEHLQQRLSEVEVGTPLLIVGFPLGFHDALHHLPVARQAAVASSFGTRFQGQGLFLTDARTHRGSSGAPVVMRIAGDHALPPGALPWKLLGIHSSRMDMGGRDLLEDESLGLNCAWYADVVMALTA